MEMCNKTCAFIQSGRFGQMSWSFTRAAILALAIAASGPALAEAAPVGQVDRIQNLVTAQRDGSTRDLALKSPLFADELLQSHDAARLEATLGDDTKITLGENAVLRIENFLYTPGSTGGRLSMKVLNGAFLFIGGKVEAPTGGNVDIATNFATLGIRGTTVWGGPLDGAFAVLVLSGEVTVTNAGTTVTLTPNTGTTIANADSPPQPPVVWGQDKVDRAIATISFSQ